MTEEFLFIDAWNNNSDTKSIYDPCPFGWRVPPVYVDVEAESVITSWDGYLSRSYPPAEPWGMGFHLEIGTFPILNYISHEGEWLVPDDETKEVNLWSALNVSKVFGGDINVGYMFRMKGGEVTQKGGEVTQMVVKQTAHGANIRCVSEMKNE